MTPDQIAALPYRPCVGVVVQNLRGDLFAGERSDISGAWQMPQGGIDAGEAPAAAALRELEEETSIPASAVQLEAELPDWVLYDLPADVIPHRWGGRYRGQKQRWFLVRYLGLDNDIRLDTAHPEFASWRWMTPEELLAAIVPFKRDVYRQVIEGFGTRIGPA